MREIKFRAWDWVDNRMKPHEIFMAEQYGFPLENNVFNDPTHDVMQFTGLLDKNLKEIYEGDIVRGSFASGLGGKSTRYKDFYVEIIWSDIDAGFVMKFHRNFNYRFYPSWQQVEVVGNVYENPELLIKIKI